MNKEIFNGFPQYIRITICAQIKKLLSTPYFGYDDREDIAQDMLCHYLYKFYEIPDVDEALVVHDLRQYALHLLDKRKRTRVHLTSSLDSDQSDGQSDRRLHGHRSRLCQQTLFRCPHGALRRTDFVPRISGRPDVREHEKHHRSQLPGHQPDQPGCCTE